MSDNQEQVTIPRAKLQKLIAQNKELKADLLQTTKSIRPLFGLFSDKPPGIAEIMGALNGIMSNPEQQKELGKLGEILDKYAGG